MPEAGSPRNLYSLHETRKVRLRVRYPGELDRLVLRTELDWDKDVLPCAIDRDASFAEFEFELAHPFLYLKPCLRSTSGVQWALGPNRLVVATLEEIPDLYPSFYGAEEGSITDVITLPSKILNRQHSLRIYLPAGYNENTCRTFPVMYMQDGRNLFFPEEAFMGQDWGVKDKLALLNGMTAIQQMMIVGIFSADRMQEYTSPGYESYGRRH